MQYKGTETEKEKAEPKLCFIVVYYIFFPEKLTCLIKIIIIIYVHIKIITH